MEHILKSLALSQDPLEQAVSVWSAARDVIRSSHRLKDDGSVAKVLFFLSLWRCHAARVRAEVRTSAFVASCAVRLAALDASHDHEAVKAFLNLLAEKSDRHQVVLLARSEGAAFRQFSVPKDQDSVLRAVKRASYSWHTTHFDDWNVVAYATCFVLDGNDSAEVTIDESFLNTCANFDAECVFRLSLRAELTREGVQSKKPEDPRVEQVTDWLKRGTTNANDEVFAIGREAFVWTFLTPEVVRKGEGTPSQRLTAWDPERGADAHKSAKGYLDYDLIVDNPLAQSLMFLFFFDYTMKQLCDISFLKLFFRDDYNGDVTLQKIETFRNERLKTPPPLIVYSMNEWHVLFRGAEAGSAVERVEVYATAMSAVLAWLDHVMTVRLGVVFMGKRINSLFLDMTLLKNLKPAHLTATTEVV
jgi:hypothetical protein